jgi:hypothetical protein
MAIRKSVEDTLVLAGPRDEWLAKCRDALDAQGLAKVDASETLFQINANYTKATVWGDLELTLLLEGTESTRITARATANVDNIFPMFGSPGRKIIDRFKQASVRASALAGAGARGRSGAAADRSPGREVPHQPRRGRPMAFKRLIDPLRRRRPGAVERGRPPDSLRKSRQTSSTRGSLPVGSWGLGD